MRSPYTISTFFLLAMFWTGSNPVIGQGVWSPLPPMPVAAGFLGNAAYNGKIYLFGGASPTHTSATNKVFVFDPADGSYTALPDLPQPTSSAGVVEVNGKIYVMGGSNAVVGSLAYNTNYIFDPATNTWETGTPMPHPRLLFATAAVEKKIYVIGGGINTYSTTKLVDVYDTETKTWSAGKDLPLPKGFLASAVVDGRIYVFGGTVDAFGIGLNTVHIFDPATGVWTSGRAMPTKRFGAAAVVRDGEIFVVGGSSLDIANPFFSTVEKYDPQTDTWQALPSMLTAGRGRTAAVIDGNIYAFGGMSLTSGSNILPTDQAEVFEISTPVTYLTEPKCRMGAAALGSKAYFAGGTSWPTLLTKVEIYDVNNNSWTYANLSQARAYTSGTSAGNKVLFAGGADFVTSTAYSTVDIFDTLTKQWTTAQLSVPRVDCAAASADGIAVFAGGASIPLAALDAVDIYNSATNTWSTAKLSEARMDIGCTVAETATGKIAFFAGGQKFGSSLSDRIDLYHFATNTWTTATLPEPRMMISAAAVGNKVLFAGGMTTANLPSDRVDILDLETGQWTTAQLSEARASKENGVTACGKVYFAGGGVLNVYGPNWLSASKRIDIYDPATGVWSVDSLSEEVVNQSVLAVGNYVLVAGGLNNSDLYVDKVEIITCQSSATGDLPGTAGAISVFPNPASDRVIFQFEQPVSGQLALIRPDGRVVYSEKIRQEAYREIPLAGLPEGVLFWRFLGINGGTASGKVMVLK